MPDYAEKGSTGKVLLEMAPIDLMPYSVLTFLDMVCIFNYSRRVFENIKMHKPYFFYEDFFRFFSFECVRTSRHYFGLLADYFFGTCASMIGMQGD